MNFDSDKIWRCDCGDAVFISITSFDESTREDGTTIEPLRYLNIDGHFSAANRRERIKELWHMLRRGRAWGGIGVLLDRKTTTEIRDELTRLLSMMETEATS